MKLKLLEMKAPHNEILGENPSTLERVVLKQVFIWL